MTDDRVGKDSQIERAVREILLSVGEDPSREGLQNTPKRVSKMYGELLAGYSLDPASIINGALFEVAYDEMVVVRDIEFQSLCEHHLLPFIGHAHVAYIPKDKIIGLSKIPRVVDLYAHRLQVQERLTRQIADFFEVYVQPRGVAVVLEAVHLCTLMRGVKKADARMITSAMCGIFKENSKTRAEFLEHIHRPIGQEF
ncbi:MAG TPA: GTP cyclohydrolase I FolE [Anaerolineales bacterium]|nr:GTP cyclohydrolase I FolE [Anaerolineales bacterium]